MIAVKGYGRWFGGSSFADAIAYARREDEDGYTIAEWSSGVASIETAAHEMTAVWAATRCDEAVDHRVISWSADETPSIEEAQDALTTYLSDIGYGATAQYVAVLHNDGRSGMVHLHVVANEIDPLTGSKFDTYDDFARGRAAMRELERAQGWRELPESGESLERATVRTSASEDRYGARKVWRDYVRTTVAPVLREAYDRADATLESVREAVGRLEIPVKIEAVVEDAKIVGARLSSFVSGLTASIAEAGIKAREFVDRFREALEAERTATREAQESVFERATRVASAVADIPNGSAWGVVHDAFKAEGLSYDAWLKSSARIADVESGKSIKAKSVDGLSRSALERRFGSYVGTAEGAAREAERLLLQARQERAVATSLAKMPEPLIESLFDKSATISRADLEMDLHRRFVSDASRDMVREAVMDRLVGVAMQREGYEEVRLTTPEYIREGERVRDAARDLLRRELPMRVSREYVGPQIAASGDPYRDRVAQELSAQSREAYLHGVASDGQLKVITGVPGAGKTTLINELAAAYREAGYEVRAVSVVTQAVKILRDETDVPARTLAKELARLEHGLGTPTAKTLYIVDEVSTVGTAQGARLLEAIRAKGATVIALGDDKQCPSVARGNALALLQDAYEQSGRTVPDLQKTARQKIEWMREATHDVRAGRVHDALEAYRQHGALVEKPTRDDAKAALVDRWREYLADGQTVAIAVLTNADRRDVNALARTAYRDLGRLSGEDVTLNTLDGRVEYAVGDLVRARKAIPNLFGEKQMGNGAEATVERIDGAVLHLRERDGNVVAWDTRQHPEIEHGYATTVHREQGRTGWGELMLLNGSVRNQTLTVGMTRHQYAFEAFYAREDFGRGFEDVVRRAERFDVKENALDGRRLGSAREAMEMVKNFALEREIERELERLDFTDELVADLGLGR